MIRYLVFDVDNTLIDFDMSLIRAEKVIADSIGVQFTEDYFTLADGMITDAWNEYQKSAAADSGIQRDWHQAYRGYLLNHYENLAEHFGSELEATELLDIHFKSLSGMKHTMEQDTLDIYIELSKHYYNVLASNSVSEIRERFSLFMPYTYRVFISDDVHAVKPDQAFFDAVTAGLGCEPAECLMIGDSRTDDMKGAKTAGFNTCWYRHGKGNEECEYADYSIGSMTELPELLDRLCCIQE